MDREHLIAMHCQRAPIPFAIHEQYHAVTAALLADVASAFSAMKTFLNALGVFVHKSLPETETRGLRFRSFGALVESAAKTSGTRLPHQELRCVLAERGAAYEKEFVEYRDKQLEHAPDLSGRTLRHGPATRIVHTGSGISKRMRRAAPRGAPLGRPVAGVAVELVGGGTYHYFHVASTLRQGQPISGGAPVGVVEDSTGVHFSEWGPHAHVFATPDVDARKFESARLVGAADDRALAESPDPFDARSELLALVREVVGMVAAARSGRPAAGGPASR